MRSDEQARQEIISELDNDWHTLKHGNPVPGLYLQTGTEMVKVRGSSREAGEKTITQYEIVVADAGKVMGHYRVVAEEIISDYRPGYTESDEQAEHADGATQADGAEEHENRE